MWKLTFAHINGWEIYDIELTHDCSGHFFSGTTKEGKRIIWSGDYLLQEISEEPLTN
jgi:hypothetical protein